MALQFPRLFHPYYGIHETVHAIRSETNGAPVETTEIERRVRQAS